MKYTARMGRTQELLLRRILPFSFMVRVRFKKEKNLPGGGYCCVDLVTADPSAVICWSTFSRRVTVPTGAMRLLEELWKAAAPHAASGFFWKMNFNGGPGEAAVCSSSAGTRQDLAARVASSRPCLFPVLPSPPSPQNSMCRSGGNSMGVRPWLGLIESILLFPFSPLQARLFLYSGGKQSTTCHPCGDTQTCSGKGTPSPLAQQELLGLRFLGLKPLCCPGFQTCLCRTVTPSASHCSFQAADTTTRIHPEPTPACFVSTTTANIYIYHTVICHFAFHLKPLAASTGRGGGSV